MSLSVTVFIVRIMSVCLCIFLFAFCYSIYDLFTVLMPVSLLLFWFFAKLALHLSYFLFLCLNVGCLSACLSVFSVWYSFYVWMLADCLLVYLLSLSDTPSMSECWLFVCLSICLLCLILLLCLNVGCLSACLSVISVWYSFYVWMLADCLLVYLSSLSDTPSCLNVGWLSASLSVISVCYTVCLSLFLSFLSFTLCSL